MRCMVKLNDLEQLVEPALGETPRTSTSGLPKDEAMDLDEGVRIEEEANVVVQFSPNEAKIGLL